ncbi:MAG: LOG family protein [Planctomycetes bacterium]|nr:LOG family protein [Planctomycetota bacterium]
MGDRGSTSRVPGSQPGRRSEAIEAFVREYAPSANEDLLSRMLVTVCRLAADQADRGDLKILNVALAELRYAFKVFEPYKDIPKVTIFGSARTPEDHPQYQEAKKFAAAIQRLGWMVITGAGSGIMQAGHDGAKREASFGVAISLPFEQATNDVILDDSKLVNFKYFFTRKLVFVKEANAIVLFPGGFGTLDEGFEAITLIQTVKTVPMPVVMCDEPGGTYWQRWRDYVEGALLPQKMIDEADLNLFCITDNAEAAVEEITGFYRQYHSCRFVGDQLVLRLNSPLSSEKLGEISSNFGDIVADGGFEQFEKPLEAEEGKYPDKARLVFNFDRRSAGRLRLLINTINRVS